MSANTLEERINELETRLEFQDETIGRLNDELVVQQQRISQLRKTVDLLQDQLRGKSDATLIDIKDELPPPHY